MSSVSSVSILSSLSSVSSRFKIIFKATAVSGKPGFSDVLNLFQNNCGYLLCEPKPSCSWYLRYIFKSKNAWYERKGSYLTPWRRSYILKTITLGPKTDSEDHPTFFLIRVIPLQSCKILCLCTKCNICVKYVNCVNFVKFSKFAKCTSQILINFQNNCSSWESVRKISVRQNSVILCLLLPTAELSYFS